MKNWTFFIGTKYIYASLWESHTHTHTKNTPENAEEMVESDVAVVVFPTNG